MISTDVSSATRSWQLLAAFNSSTLNGRWRCCDLALRHFLKTALLRSNCKTWLGKVLQMSVKNFSDKGTWTVVAVKFYLIYKHSGIREDVYANRSICSGYQFMFCYGVMTVVPIIWLSSVLISKTQENLGNVRIKNAFSVSPCAGRLNLLDKVPLEFSGMAALTQRDDVKDISRFWKNSTRIIVFFNTII